MLNDPLRRDEFNILLFIKRKYFTLSCAVRTKLNSKQKNNNTV